MKINEVFELLDEFFDGKRPKEIYENQINVGGVEIFVPGNTLNFNTGIKIKVVDESYILVIERRNCLFNFPESPELMSKVSHVQYVLFAQKGSSYSVLKSQISKDKAREIILGHLEDLRLEALNFMMLEEMAFIDNISQVISKNK